MIERPKLDRQTTGLFFGEDAVFVSVSQTRNERGMTQESETRRPVRLATNPISRERAGTLIEGNNRLEDFREFFTAFPVDVKERDRIIYAGDTYTIVETARYNGHSESIGKRVDG